MNRKYIDDIILKYSEPSGKILGILEDIQEKDKYLSKESIKYVAKKIDVPFSQIYSIATFYSFFNLQPVGEHIISVCMGTACHVRGAVEILKNIEYLLDVGVNETTDDGKFFLTTEDKNFSLNTARCFGCCSMAPVVRIDDKIYGYVKIKDLPKILKEYGWNKK
jgi:NADH-quinone oxidoreductase subunit E